ncbi:MAG: winged helix-turn-helix domain-containing protein [archaeon]
MEKNNIWDDISFIIRSKHRKNILKLLDKPKTPTQIKKTTGLHFNIVSRTIIELEKNGFLKCLNPQQKLIRFYQITKRGKDLLNKLESMKEILK